MLRVLTLSTLFPDATRPDFGVFVERQTQGLAMLPDVELKVAAPVGAPPWPLSLHARWRGLAGLPDREAWRGLDVLRPRFRVWPGLGGAGMPAAMASALLPILRDLRQDFPFDVIDAEFFWPDGPAAMRLAGALGVPFSIKARGADIHHWAHEPACREPIVEAGRAAGGLLAVSGALKADMIALGLPGEKITVHHTGVDLDRFQPADHAAAKAALGLTGPVLLCIGHLIARKGQRLAIEALAELPDATLLLVGEGPDSGALETVARAAGVADRVRFLGGIAHAELPAIYAAANIFVLPTASEGLANVWIEALAAGVPVVTSDVGGAREAIDRPEAGRLVARDAHAITAAVRELLAEPPPPHIVRAAAEHFTWQANAAALHAHLTRVADQAAKASPSSA